MFLTLIVFFITLSTLVLVHELGHFLAAKKAGIKVEEFGLGYPPRIFGVKIGETVYSVNWVLFGGFVKLFGEELADQRRSKRGSTLKRAFWAKSKKARTAVILAGVAANFLLAIFVFSVVYSFSGIPTKTDQVRIIGVVSNSPAEKTGLKENDIVLSVDGQELRELDDFIKLIDEKRGNQVGLMVVREKDNPCLEKVLGGGPVIEEKQVGFSCQNGNLVLWITPRESPPEGEGSLGVIISNIVMRHYPFWQMPFRGTIEGFKEAFAWTSLIINALGGMLVDLITQGVVPKDIAGPIGILQITNAVAQTGVLNILQFIGILSVNLAIINVLPFPALDGGRLIFVGYELVTRRRPKPIVEHWVNTVGMAFLIFLIVLVTANDLKRVIETTSLLQRLQAVWPF